jgi:ABC-2 type transport system permease protein
MTATSRAQLAPTVPSMRSRIYGFGSVFAKTVRDSRRATILVGVVLGLALLGVGKAITSQFATPASRQEIVNLVTSVPPFLQGFAGKPINVGTLGGYLQYKYGTFFPIIVSLWSILALSGTLAAEARRGSLEFVAAAPISRRRVALEKLSGHIAVVVVAAALIFASLAIVGSSFPVLPGDEIPVAAAAAYAVWLALLGLAAGALAFALAQFLGRGAAIGIAGAVTFGGFILNGYQAALPDLAPVANLTWFGWTTNHIPLAGLYDWPSVALVAVAVVVLLAIGVEAFVRRDLGATSAVPSPSLPSSLIGLNGPVGRAAGELLPKPWRGASGSACSGCSSPARASPSPMRSRNRPISCGSCSRSSRASSSAAPAASCSSCSSNSGSSSPGWLQQRSPRTGPPTRRRAASRWSWPRRWRGCAGSSRARSASWSGSRCSSSWRRSVSRSGRRSLAAMSRPRSLERSCWVCTQRRWRASESPSAVSCQPAPRRRPWPS